MNTHAQPMQQPSAAHVSPMRMIGRLLWRLKGRGEDSLELDVIARQIQREQQVVTQATGEAEAIEGTFCHLRVQMYAYLHDKRSPGVIDAHEATELARDLLAGTSQAHTHTETLQAIS